MIHSHLLALLVFSGIVASVFAALLRDEPRARLRFGARVFTAFVAAAIVLGWLMAPIPR